MSAEISPYDHSFFKFDDFNSSFGISDIFVSGDNQNENMNDSIHDPIPLGGEEKWALPTLTIAFLSFLFILIVLVGILGNGLVIALIFGDAKMRRSVTNMLITNLAISDLVIMILGVPEIVMVMKNSGWILGLTACRSNRFLMVAALYSSVLSLLILCCERFIAIVFPFKVSKLCTRRKTVITIGLSWVTALCCALPVAIYNRLTSGGGPVEYCQILLPGGDPMTSFLIYKYTEAALFYFIPMIIQIVLYAFIAKRLFTSNEQLRTRFQEASSLRQEINTDSINSNSNSEITTSATHSPVARANSRTEMTIKAREGVVKMLVCCVLLYFISYSPLHFQLIFNTFSSSSAVFTSHEFFIFVIIVTHINSAANPILYGIFSQNFRRRFEKSFKSCFACLSHLHRRRYKVNAIGLTKLTSLKSSSHGAKTSMSKL